MYTYKLKYYPGAIQGKGNDPATMIEHSIKPLVEGSLSREMQGYRKRIKFEGKISLIDNKKEGCNDYTLFKQIEALNAGKTIYIEINEGNLIFTGYFYPFNCTVNDDNCTVELPELMPVDEYTVFDEYGDIKFNLIDEIPPYTQVNINEPVRMEYYVSERDYDYVTMPNGYPHQWVSPSPGNFSTIAYIGMPYEVGLGQGLDWHPSYGQYILFSSWQLRFMPTVFPYGAVNTPARDALVALCRIVKNEIKILSQNQYPYYTINTKTTWALEVNYSAYNPATGQPQMPTGSGWTLLEAGVIIHGVPHSKWGRIPFYDKYIVDDNEQTYIYALSNSVAYDYFEYSLVNPYSGSYYSLYNTTIAYRGRPLVNVIQFFANKMGLNATTSQFFYSTLNPITGEPNQYYTLHTVKDIAEPTAPDASPLMEMSWNDLMSSLQAHFPVDWVMNNGMLTIEHQKYFENGGSYVSDINLISDVRWLQNNSIGKQQIIRTNNYTYDQGNIFNIETFNTNQFVTEEFKPLSILYGIFTKEKKEINYNSRFITDAGGIFTSPGTFPNDAIVLLAAKYIEVSPNNFQWECEAEQDYLSQLTVCNGHLSPANLITRYWMDFRQFLTGNFEQNNITFNSETKKKLQKISISDCNVVYLQTNNLIKTNLGIGKIISSRHNLLKKTTELTILIGYAEH